MELILKGWFHGSTKLTDQRRRDRRPSKKIGRHNRINLLADYIVRGHLKCQIYDERQIKYFKGRIPLIDVLNILNVHTDRRESRMTRRLPSLHLFPFAGACITQQTMCIGPLLILYISIYFPFMITGTMDIPAFAIW